MIRGFVRANELYDVRTGARLFVCNECSVRIVEVDPKRTDLCPVCRTDGEPSTHPPISQVRGDYL